MLTSIEICAGAGGQALGLEQAGFKHLRLIENDPDCCRTLRAHKPWRDVTREIDVQEFRARRFEGQVDLLAAGVPCPPFSRAGKQLGPHDERDLFPEAIRLVEECCPHAILLENVRGLLTGKFDHYREQVQERLDHLGYWSEWRQVTASAFGVPQLRPRAVLVAVRKRLANHFSWPGAEDESKPPTVGQALAKEMARAGWLGATEWAENANDIAPTLVGGSKKHGGPDLGPTQAKKRWAELGVDAHLVASGPPPPDWGDRKPRLSVRMAAILQGFPSNWEFTGTKTAQYRQVGNAFPPPVARAIGRSVKRCLEAAPGADVVPYAVAEKGNRGQEGTKAA